jgi:geranylgeranylglycerol-phosphate geranylgeranyltransferase
MRSWIDIIRPLNCAMSSLGVAIGAFLVSPAATSEVLLAVLAAFLITGAGNVVNDVTDVESDRINRPKRPIPSGRISKGWALAVSLALFAAGILLASLINNVLCLLIAVVNSALLVLYSFNLQNKVLLGNMNVAYLASSTFLFGGAAAGDITLPLLLMLLSGLATFSREVVKDLEDLEGDRKSFIKRMAKRVSESFGERFRVGQSGIKLRYKTIYAILFASFSLWMAVVVSAIPYIWDILGLAYLLILVPTDAVLIAGSIILIRTRNYGLTSKLIKIGMFLGLAAFLAGVLF